MDYEIDKTPDGNRKFKLKLLTALASQKISVSDEIVDRAKELKTHGIKPLDALHLASAETEKVDVFFTTDSKFLNKAKTAGNGIIVENPLSWWIERE